MVRAAHLILCLLWMPAGCVRGTLMVVGVPVSDLRAKPNTAAARGAHDPLQESQLLYGEEVRVLSVKDGWARIEATEQPEFTHASRWQGYPGWVPMGELTPWDSALEPTIVVTEKWVTAWQEPFRHTPASCRFPLGARLKAIDMGGQFWKIELLDGGTVWLPRAAAQLRDTLRLLSPQEKRRAILHSAEQFLGDPYFWGGRSPGGEDTRATGVDCSGLVNLAYRSVEMDLPRDAHEQFLRAEKIETPQPPDLIFLSEREHPTRIVHVMLYAGHGEILEAPGTGSAVRRIRVEERLGRSLEHLTPGTVVDGQTVFFGTYFSRVLTPASAASTPR